MFPAVRGRYKQKSFLKEYDVIQFYVQYYVRILGLLKVMLLRDTPIFFTIFL